MVSHMISESHLIELKKIGLFKKQLGKAEASNVLRFIIMSML